MTSALKACLRRNITTDVTGLVGDNMDDGNSKKILSVSPIKIRRVGEKIVHDVF